MELKMSKFRELVAKILAENGYSLDEEKIYDKDSGYNVSEDEEYYWDMIKKKWPDAQKSQTLDFFRNPYNHRPWLQTSGQNYLL